MNKIYEFPMTIDEAALMRDCLLELRHIQYVGMKHFTVEKKNMLDDLLDSLNTWIKNRSIE